MTRIIKPDARDERARIPEDILSLLKEYRNSNPLNPRTGEAWGTIAEVLRFAICSIEPLAELDTSLIKSLYRLPTVQGDFRGYVR